MTQGLVVGSPLSFVGSAYIGSDDVPLFVPTFLSKVGSFNSGTGAVASTVVVTGVGFQPKAVVFWWTRSTTTGVIDEVLGGSMNIGVGFASGAANRNCAVSQSTDASATSDSNKYFYTDACIVVTIADGSAVEGLLDFTSFDADGFTLTVDDQFASSWHIHYLALGGVDITNAYVGSTPSPLLTGNQSITDPGFQPDVILTWSSFGVTAGGREFMGALSFGAATSSTQRGVAGIWSRDGQADTQVGGYGYNEEFAASPTTFTESMADRADFVSFDATGFTLNWLETLLNDCTIGYLVIKGGKWIVGDLTTRTDGNNIVENGFGFTPSFGLFGSVNAALSTQDVLAGDAKLSIGAFDSPTSRAACAIIDVDAQATSVVAYSVQHDAVYINLNSSDTVEGLMDIQSVELDGFTCVMDDTDPSAMWVWYLAGGSNPVSLMYNDRTTRFQGLLVR